MSESHLHKTALRVIQGYNTWTIDAILAPRHTDCTQRVYPARLDRPQLNNSQYREFFSGILPLFQNFHVQVLEVFEDRERHKVALHARSTAETAIGPYANEYSLFLSMTEDDEEVIDIKEFVDSGYSEEYFKQLRAHLAALPAEKGDGESVE